jgi:hypothetical protein
MGKHGRKIDWWFMPSIPFKLQAHTITMQKDSKEAGYHGLGYAKDGKVYLKSSLGKPERIIGDVKAGEDEAVDYFVRRFDLIQKKVDSMLEAMEKAENKGSYLMQVLHLKDSLYSFNAIGPFEELKEKLEEAENQIKYLIENNRVKNLDQKKELLEKAKIEAENPDIRAAIKGIKDIRFSWMTIGSVSKESEEALETEFQEVLDKFQILKDKYTEERNIEIEIRRQKLLILLETASRLNTYPPEVEQSFFKMRKLEDEWKAVGNVPKAIYGPLFEQFKRIKKTIAKYARKGPQSGGGGNRNYGPRPIEMPRYIPENEQPLYDNLQRRIDLIDEAQSLLKIDLRQANEMAKDIQARWKNAGQIPDKYKSEVFNQFNAISDRIFESSYLARVVHTKYPHFRTMAPAEQLEAKIEAMDDIILKEDMTVKITQAEFEFMSPEERQLEENRSRFSRLNTSLRKLKMKHKILQELRRELDRLKNGGNSSYGGYQQRERSPYPPRTNYGGGGYQDRGGYQNRNSGGGYQDRNSGGGYQDRNSGGGYQDRNSGGGYQDRNSGGGYQDRNSGGGYQDRNSGGGYQDRNSGGGYQDRNSGGGYQDRNSGGGYQDRNSGGGYQDRDRNGYTDRGSYNPDRPAANRDGGYERRPYGDRPPGSGYSSDRNRAYEPPPRFTSKPTPEKKPGGNESEPSGQ